MFQDKCFTPDPISIKYATSPGTCLILKVDTSNTRGSTLHIFQEQRKPTDLGSFMPEMIFVRGDSNPSPSDPSGETGLAGREPISCRLKVVDRAAVMALAVSMMTG